MTRIEIKDRSHVRLLVTTFYGKIRTHEILGPIFEGIINDWEEHFEILTNFWETQLFLKRKYHGNPIKAHLQVDQKMDHNITSEHFGLWLNLWFETVDKLFEGDTAFIAKNRAQKMSTMLYLEMFKSRSK